MGSDMQGGWRKVCRRWRGVDVGARCGGDGTCSSRGRSLVLRYVVCKKNGLDSRAWKFDIQDPVQCCCPLAALYKYRYSQGLLWNQGL